LNGYILGLTSIDTCKKTQPNKAVTQKEEIKVPNKDVIKGKATQAKGLIKEATGDATGKTTTKIAGKAEQAAGKAQEAIGHAKDRVKEAATKEH
jgi:uncharacterized protein YjbJ (UPF0337 family)